MRIKTPQGIDQIIDLNQAQMMSLVPTQKKAMFLEFKNIPDSDNSLRRANMFADLQKRIQQAQENEDESVEYLGEQEIDGLPAIGYLTKDPEGKMNFWADAQTLLPIRIEMLVKMVGAEGTIVMSDFEFNIDLDESLFSLEVPDGYTRHEAQMDMTNFTEQDLIEGLRVWAEMMGDVFPHNLDTTDARNLELWKKKLIETKMSEPEQIKRVMKVARSWLFIRTLKAESDWHYAGNGVRLGEANKAIFWYRPVGSETYRIIYGDLSIKDVAADELPEVSK
ncbi:MAG: hypothetical protein JSV03_15440 [Planctomycetota bacterium]|nr:MAG: hypothetical protein JSV03_15440 [Planctomycetota bacterium]